METTDPNALLQPLFALGLLTCAMAVWMFLTRIPAMNRLGIHPQKAQDTSKLGDYLPPNIMRVSNNYNHLFEQPTLFYAVALAIAVLGHVDALHVQCAWAFVILRVAHSLVQATIDLVMLRFVIFCVSWLVLGAMVIRGAIAVF